MYTPRHLRKGTGVNKSGPGKQEKSRAFRHAKKLSDRFIHQSASMLEGKLNDAYQRYCKATDGFKSIRK